jgi:hypothetical protein
MFDELSMLSYVMDNSSKGKTQDPSQFLPPTPVHTGQKQMAPVVPLHNAVMLRFAFDKRTVNSLSDSNYAKTNSKSTVNIAVIIVRS